MLDNALRKVAEAKGYVVGYDNATKKVTVENPTTKKKISFDSGQGSEYGLGGIDQETGQPYGYNVVSDISLFDKSLAADPQPVPNYFGNSVNQLQRPFDYQATMNQYKSPYSDAIGQLVQKIVNIPPFDYSQYNPDTDNAYQQFKGSAIKAGNEAYANTYAGTATPGVAESSIGRQIAETARKGYTDQIQEAIPTFADKARQQHESNYNRNYDVLNTLTSLRDSDLKNAGTMQGYLANEAKTIAMANYDNIQAEIDRRAATDPNDPLIPYLMAERQGKIFEQTNTESKQATAQSEAQQALQKYALDIWKTLGTANEQVSSILGVPVGAKTADYNIDSINANTSSKNAETARINANKKEDTTKPVFNADDFYKDANTMKNKVDENKQRIYSDNEIISYVFNSGLDDNSIAAVLTRLGYSDTQVESYLNSSTPAYFGEFQKINQK